MPTSRGRAELLARLATFTPARWPGEPLSALECARRGWRLEPGPLLRCAACQAAVPARLPGAGKPKLRAQCVERLQRLVTEGHRAGCRWAAGPLPAGQLRPPLAEPAAERRRVAEALARLTAASVQLPTSTVEQEPQLEPETAAALLTEALGADTPHDERALAALSYVLGGWELSSDERYLHCSFGCRTWDTSFSPAPEVTSVTPAPEVASFSPAPEVASFSPATEVEKTPSAGADLIQNALDECGFNELDFDVGTPASAAGDTSGKDRDVSGDARVEGEEGSGDGRRDGGGEEAGSDNESESGPKGSPLSSNVGDADGHGMESMESSHEDADDDVDVEVDVDSELSASDTGVTDADHPSPAADAAAGDDASDAAADDGDDDADDGDGDDDDADDGEGSDVVVASSPEDAASRERSTPDAVDPQTVDSSDASAEGSPAADDKPGADEAASPGADEAETPEDSPIAQTPVSPSLAESGSSRSEMSPDAVSLTPTQQDGVDQQTQDSSGDGGDGNDDGDASGGEEEEGMDSANEEVPVPEEVSPVPSDVEIVSSASEASQEPPGDSVGDSGESGSTAGSEERADSGEMSPAPRDGDGDGSESAGDSAAGGTADTGSSADDSSQDSNPEEAVGGSENDGSRADGSPLDHSSEDADHSQTSPPPPPSSVESSVTEPSIAEPSADEPSAADPCAAEPSAVDSSAVEPSGAELTTTADSAPMDSSPSPAPAAAAAATTTAAVDAEQRTPTLKRSADSAAAGSSAKRIRRRPAGPLEGHRCWCPWVAGVDGGQPGWRRAVTALMTTPAPCGERLWGEDDALDTMRRVWATLDQWTSPPAKPAVRA